MVLVDQFSRIKWITFRLTKSGANLPDGTKLKGPYSPDGPTYDEWLVMQESQVDEQAVSEINEAINHLKIPVSFEQIADAVEDANLSLKYYSDEPKRTATA